MTDFPVTPEGRAYCIMRLSDCPDIGRLEFVWGTFSKTYQRDPEVQKHKDRMKEAMK